MAGGIPLLAFLWMFNPWADISAPIHIPGPAPSDRASYGDWLPGFLPPESGPMTLHRHTAYSLSLVHCAMSEDRLADLLKSGVPHEPPRRSAWPRGV